MAASYLSDRSSIAPTDFAVCSSFDEENGVISVAVENCQLCGCGRKPFYCPTCVKNGDFFHSNETQKTTIHCSAKESKPFQAKQRYREKLTRLQSLKRDKLQLLERFKQLTSKKTILQQKQLELSSAKQRVDLLTRAVEEATQKQCKENEDLQNLQKSNDSVTAKAAGYREKKRRISEYLERLRLGIDNRRGELAVCEHQLCHLRQQHIKNLMNHIFPITQVQPRNDTDVIGHSYVSELAEARHTAYVKGRWVYLDNGSEHQYRIVKPTLPGNGDYSAYLNWLLDKSCSPAPDNLTGDGHPSFTIGAALTYTTQLVQLIAYFLDVNLPEKLCYSNFCQNTMSERRFNRLVYKLNHNVLHLCFSQRVDPVLLHPRHTIHNILMLLKTEELGRCRPFDIDHDMIQSLEVPADAASSSLSLSDSESDTDATMTCDEVDANPDQDWERVPSSIPEASTMSSDYYPASPGASQTTGDNQASRVGGLMSTAAASVTSLWRAATWKS